jgi:hypothetical protein
MTFAKLTTIAFLRLVVCILGAMPVFAQSFGTGLERVVHLEKARV